MKDTKDPGEPEARVLDLRTRKPNLPDVYVMADGSRATRAEIYHALKNAYTVSLPGEQLRAILALDAFQLASGEPAVSLADARKWVREGGWDDIRNEELIELQDELRRIGRQKRVKAAMERHDALQTMFMAGISRVLQEDLAIKSAEGAWSALATVSTNLTKLEELTYGNMAADTIAEASRPTITSELSPEGRKELSRMLVGLKRNRQVERAQSDGGRAVTVIVDPVQADDDS